MILVRMASGWGEEGEEKRVYTTRLQKGGALIDDMRRLILEWDCRADASKRIVASNLLSSPTRARSHDVLIRAFNPRFVRSTPPDIWHPLAIFERAGWSREQLLPFHYYLAAAAEPLMWDFVVDELGHRAGTGRLEVSVADIHRFLEDAPLGRFPSGRWTPTVSTKVARGLLVALRDFGVLSGASKKRLSTLFLPVESFAFLVLIRHLVGRRGRGLVTDPCWKLFFLSELAVERFLAEAHQRKLLGFHAAGSLFRVEFPTENLEEYANALVERTN